MGCLASFAAVSSARLEGTGSEFKVWAWATDTPRACFVVKDELKNIKRLTMINGIAVSLTRRLGMRGLESCGGPVLGKVGTATNFLSPGLTADDDK